MDLKGLRSRLVYVFDDLRNLTIAELKECPWKVQKMIFTDIIIASPNFSKQADDLSLLNEQRDVEMQSLRSANAPREARKDAEMEYRRRFLQVVVECCVDAQWPPAMEAFANPQRLLTEDPEARLHAMDYLLTNAILSSSSDATFLDTPSSPAATSPLPSPPPKITPRSKPRTPLKHSPSKAQQVPPATPSTSRSSFSRKVAQPTENDYAALLASYEILQHHNEQLSKQLKVMQDSVCVRTECENKMDILFDEVKSVIAQFVTSDNKQECNKNVAAPTTERKNVPRAQSLSAYIDKSSTAPEASSKGLWSSALHRLKDIHAQWRESRDAARGAVAESISLHSSCADFVKVPPLPSEHVHRIAVHKLFGVRPPLSLWRDTHSMTDEADSTRSVALDISRVHTLQRDLVGFSKAAFDYLHSSDSTLTGGSNGLVENAQLEALRGHSRHLLLRTACVAPLLPLASGSALSSSSTGLNAFIDLVNAHLGKRITPEIQQAADRSRSENYALISCFMQTERTLKNWAALSASLVPELNALSHRLQSRLSAATKEIHAANSKLLKLSSLYRNAEEARIAPTPTSVPVCPLDALTRGCMGEEVATLVNCLRLDAEDISKLTQIIQSIRKQFAAEVTADIKEAKALASRFVKGEMCTKDLIDTIHPVISEEVSS